MSISLVDTSAVSVPLDRVRQRLVALGHYVLKCQLISTIADGKCIIDLTQTSFPSHVRYNELIAAGWIIQQECIEKDVTPCTYKFTFLLPS